MTKTSSSVGRRTVSRRTGVIALLAAVAILGGTGVPTWLTTHTTSVLGESVDVAVSGIAAVDPLLAAVLLHAAGAIACLLAGKWARRVVFLLTATTSAIVGYTTLGVLTDPVPVAANAASEAVGTPTFDGVDLTIWPYLTAVAAAAFVLIEIFFVFASSDQSTQHSKYDRRGTTAPDRAAPEEVTASGQWDAFDQGEDPTET